MDDNCTYIDDEHMSHSLGLFGQYFPQGQWFQMTYVYYVSSIIGGGDSTYSGSDRYRRRRKRNP